MTITRKFSVTPHINYLLAACAQTLFALRTLRHHGLHNNPVQAILATVVAISSSMHRRLGWASQMLRYDSARLQAFLKRSISFGYRSASSPNFARIVDEADNKLFSNILSNTSHLLHPLLPPLRDSHYTTSMTVHTLTSFQPELQH